MPIRDTCGSAIESSVGTIKIMSYQLLEDNIGQGMRSWTNPLAAMRTKIVEMENCMMIKVDIIL